MSQYIVEKIKAGKFSRKELENLYSNAKRLGRDEILREAKGALKALDLQSYVKRFVKPIKDRVKKIAEKLADDNHWAAWEDNRSGNGVRAGGAMLNGEELAEYYFSYKHEGWEKPSYLAVFQHDEESTVMYKIGPHDGDQSVVDTSEQAIRLFEEAIKTA